MRPFIDRLRSPLALRFSAIAACGAVLLAAFASCGGDEVVDAEGEPEWTATVRRLHGASAIQFGFFRGGGLELLVEDTASWNADRQAALILETFAAARRSFETDLDLVVPGLDTTRPVRAVVAASSRTYDLVAGRTGVFDRGARRERYVTYLSEHDFAVFDRDFETSAVAAYAARGFVSRFRPAPPGESQARQIVSEALFGRYLGVVRTCAADVNNGAWNYEFARIDPNWVKWTSGHAPSVFGVVDAILGEVDVKRRAWPNVTELSAAFLRPPGKDEIRRTTIRSMIWLFDAFLRDFAVDSDGFVRFDRPGEYRDVWRTIVRTNLQAGLPPLDLHRALSDAGVDVPKLETRFAAWLDWTSRKVAIRHFAQGRLIPWDQFRNRRDQATGDREDDRLAVKR